MLEGREWCPLLRLLAWLVLELHTVKQYKRKGGKDVKPEKEDKKKKKPALLPENMITRVKSSRQYAKNF